jgi:acetylornithine deacetylase/succinyl-diaminopimelate desuccinylase-like protein
VQNNRLLLLSALTALICLAQDPQKLLRDPAVKAALEAAKSNEPQTIARQIQVCEIAAPPFHETTRGLDLKQRFLDLGLKDVRIDKAGNVIGTRPGVSPRPNLLFSAHLDTVFPEETAVKVSREGHILKGPGIGDDCRGLAVMLATIQALDQAKVQTPGTITFVADVGEEGLGDLRGVKNLFYESMPGQIDKFISVDGNGLSIVNIGVGSMRYRVTFKGPGGHSYGAFGMANAIQAMGRAIAKISDFKVPANPKTTFNVGRVGGGTSINAIPSDAWMEVDMRSTDVSSLKALDDEFLAAVHSAVEEENRRWNNRGKVSASPELVGLRPAGQTPEGSPIVQTALAVSRALGIVEGLREGSTDANVPMNMNIPAITIGGGGSGSGVHTLNETFDATDSWHGTQRAVLLAIALAR